MIHTLDLFFSLFLDISTVRAEAYLRFGFDYVLVVLFSVEDAVVYFPLMTEGRTGCVVQGSPLGG